MGASLNQLTVVELIYHRRQDDQPIQFESRFSRNLNTDEQAYDRRCKARSEWQLLDLGWIEQAGHISIENCEGHFNQVQPTDDERKEAESRVIELGWLIDGEPQPKIIIPVHESCRFTPTSGSQIYVRCQSGIANYNLRVIPN